MDEKYFKRIQISVLFIISFLGGLTHMALHTMAGESGVWVWIRDTLLPGLENPSSISIPEHATEMTGWTGEGMLIFIAFYFFAMIVPAGLSLISGKKVSRWIVAVLGTIMVAMGILDGFAHMFTRGEWGLGLSGLLIGGIADVIAVVLAYRWALIKDE
ncbi:MAG TPA: hypothetical protein ENG29_04040 [Firmicutes bacterium]|nr:hypothetical protein [Bacillota bacterium]